MENLQWKSTGGKDIETQQSYCHNTGVRNSVSQLSLNLMHGIRRILVIASPEPYAGTFFEVSKKYLFFYEYLSFSLTWGPMGAKISKRYSSYKSQPKVLKLLLNFLPNGPHKSTVGIFEILKIEILVIFNDFFSFR